jgi:hypothetical protein
MICRTTVATFNLSLSDELGGPVLTARFQKFLLWQMLLNGVLHAFPFCPRCLWLLVLSILTQCSCVGLLW